MAGIKQIKTDVMPYKIESFFKESDYVTIMKAPELTVKRLSCNYFSSGFSPRLTLGIHASHFGRYQLR